MGFIKNFINILTGDFTSKENNRLNKDRFNEDMINSYRIKQEGGNLVRQDGTMTTMLKYLFELENRIIELEKED